MQGLGLIEMEGGLFCCINDFNYLRVAIFRGPN
jgi:hypothetical protein